MSRSEAEQHVLLAWDKLQVAEELLRAGHVRDAASRVYYAFFHGAQALLRAKGENARTHRGVAHRLLDLYVTPGTLSEELYNAYRKSQAMRETGDYEIIFAPGEEEVEVLVESATGFLEAVERILGAAAS